MTDVDLTTLLMDSSRNISLLNIVQELEIMRQSGDISTENKFQTEFEANVPSIKYSGVITYLGEKYKIEYNLEKKAKIVHGKIKITKLKGFDSQILAGMYFPSGVGSPWTGIQAEGQNPFIGKLYERLDAKYSHVEK